MKKFLDLGLQPLANSYLDSRNLHRKEKKFRLVIGFDPKNYLVSILNTVPPSSQVCQADCAFSSPCQ